MAKNASTIDVHMTIRIINMEKYKKLLGREVAKSNAIVQYSEHTLPLSILWVLRDNPDIWRIGLIEDYKVCGRKRLVTKLAQRADPKDIACWSGWTEGVRA